MATKKQVVVDTDKHRGLLFRVSESGGRFHVYREAGPLGFDRDIGETRSLDDAIQLIKSDLGCPVHNIRIS